MKLLHISPCKNRESIFRDGLKYVDEPSKYGNVPEHRAVYLYHSDNINVFMDMLNIYEIFDIYEVTNIDESLLLPDEDSGENNWQDSLNKFGTVAYQKSISHEDIKIKCTVHNPNFKEKRK